MICQVCEELTLEIVPEKDKPTVKCDYVCTNCGAQYDHDDYPSPQLLIPDELRRVIQHWHWHRKRLKDGIPEQPRQNHSHDPAPKIPTTHLPDLGDE